MSGSLPDPFAIDCLWCGGTGLLATFTEDGGYDQTTTCACILSSALDKMEAAFTARNVELGVLREERDRLEELAEWWKAAAEQTQRDFSTMTLLKDEQARGVGEERDRLRAAFVALVEACEFGATVSGWDCVVPQAVVAAAREVLGGD